MLVELTAEGRATLTLTRRRRDKWMTERVAELTGDERARKYLRRRAREVE